MNSRILRWTVASTLIFLSIVAAPVDAANVVYNIPFFTGADAGVGDDQPGVFTDANGANWQCVRGSGIANGFDAMLLNRWSDARNRWESPGFAAASSAYEAGPCLYSTEDQTDSIIVFSAPVAGEYSMSGTLFLNGTNLNSVGEVKIRADIFHQGCGLSTVGVEVARFAYNAFFGQPNHTEWNLGLESALAAIDMQANDRLLIRCRKVGTAGELRGDISGVTITGPDVDIPAITNLLAHAASLTLASQAGTEYTIQSESALAAGTWTDTQILSGSGSDMTILVDAAASANNSYRYTTGQRRRTVTWFSGPDLGVLDGEEPDPGFVDVDGGTWRHHRNSPWGNYSGMRTQQWSSVRERWESTSLTGSSEAFENGPLINANQPTLWTGGDQADAILIYTPNVPAGGGNYSFNGILELDATDTAGGIRAQVMHYDAAGASTVLYSFSSGTSTFDVGLDLGEETNLQNIAMLPGERLGLGFRKVSSAGYVEGRLYGEDPVTIIGPPSPPIPFDAVSGGDAPGFSFASQAGAEYSLQWTTNKVTDGWCPIPSVAIGTGADLVVFDANHSSQATYRVMGKLP
jgi:hypothetical protein